MAGRSISLSLAAMDIVGELLRSNVRQFPFQIPGLGEFVEDRIRIAGAVLVDLQKRGLVRSNGDFVPDVILGLRLLSEFQVAIAVMGTVGDGREVYARASTDGRDCVLITKQDQMLRFEFIQPEGLVHSVVNLLPKLKAGPGQSVSIAQPEAAGTQRRPDEESPQLFTTASGPRSNSDAQLRAAQVIMQRPRTGAGDFVITIGAKGLDPNGPGLTWLDTDEGRYMIRTERGKDGRNWGTFVPADSTRLVQQLTDMVAPARFGTG